MSDPGPTVLVGAAVITMDVAQPRAEAVALADGKILAVGPLADVALRAGVRARTVKLDGGAILPGFIDPHHHLFLVAAERWSCRLHDPAPQNIAALLKAVRRAVAEDHGSGWLRVHGHRPLSMTELRSPTAAELDAACPDRPLHVIGLTYHESSVNSLGLARLGWGRRTPDPPGGRIV
ncbi:amidohydrolase family protein, partial [mine drainage metagenome]